MYYNKNKRGKKVFESADELMLRQSRPVLPIGNAPLTTFGAMAKEIGKIKRSLNAELKFLDGGMAATTLDQTTGGFTVALTPPAQGDTQNQRNANSIKLTRIDIKFKFRFSWGTAAATNLEQDQTFNWYIIRWLKTPTSAGSTPPGISDVFGQDVGSDYSTESLPKPDFNQNYQVIASGLSKISLFSDPSTQTLTATSCHDSVSKVVNFHQIFSSTTAASITENLVFMVFLAQNTLNTGGVSTAEMTTRMWYVDN